MFTLKAPSASFPLALRIGIIAKHIFGGMAPAQIAASPYSGVQAFGTGPFKVGAVNQLAITLDRNPYANPQPYLDHLVLRTYPATDPQSAIRAVGQGVADLVGGLEPQEVDALQAIASNVSVVDSFRRPRPRCTPTTRSRRLRRWTRRDGCPPPARSCG